MTRDQVAAINRDRLARWAEKLTREHATPVLLLGVGHDHTSGQVVLCTLEDLDDAKLAIFLRGALVRLEAT